VHEDDAFECFARAFAQVELHLQRSLTDPLDDTSHHLAAAERYATELTERWIDRVPAAADLAAPVVAETANIVQDDEISAAFLDVFLEESESIVLELGELVEAWSQDPEPNQLLRDIKRHFHTFKGNGRAVGANVLGELGWAAQDMLDRVLEGEMAINPRVQELVRDVTDSLPALVASYRDGEAPDVQGVRQLTNRCLVMTRSGDRGTTTGPGAAVQDVADPTRLASQSPNAEINSQ
jgi:hypothetical protein